MKESAYEVEIKIEITAEEREKLLAKFKERNFVSKGTTQQNDYYIHAEATPIGAYDIQRYRKDDDEYIYTEKFMEMVEGSLARRENQHSVTKEEFESKIQEFPNAVKIQKRREWFDAKNNGVDVSVIIDTVKFDHSPNVRYFIEPEMNTQDKTKVKEMREGLANFLRDLLEKSELIESPGMFHMAFEKK